RVRWVRLRQSYFCDVILSRMFRAAKPKAKNLCICPAFFWTVLRVPALAQIRPLGIHGHNECQLLNPKQPFDLLFTLDGGGHADEALVVDEAVNPVAGSKSGKRPGLVLEHALAEIAGYPGVAFASDWS